MPTRQQFLRHVWDQLIDCYNDESVVDNIIRNDAADPGGPFGDTGEALQRMIDAGASRRDLCRFARSVAYGTSFALLYALDDPGVDGGDVFMLHEELLTADQAARKVAVETDGRG